METLFQHILVLRELDSRGVGFRFRVSVFRFRVSVYDAVLPCSLLQQPGPNKFKLSKIELINKARKFKVPPFTI